MTRRGSASSARRWTVRATKSVTVENLRAPLFLRTHELQCTEQTLARRTHTGRVSAARKRLFYAHGLWEAGGTHNVRRSARGCFPNILWRTMNVPKMQQGTSLFRERSERRREAPSKEAIQNYKNPSFSRVRDRLRLRVVWAA